jgi:hypothetical protein
MSNPTAISPRPVSLVTIVFVLALFGAFALLVSRYYHPSAIPPENQRAENLPKDGSLDWKATPETRKQALAELREKQIKQANSYGWVDQKAGVVQLPIERAMELTVEKYGAKK